MSVREGMVIWAIAGAKVGVRGKSRYEGADHRVPVCQDEQLGLTGQSVE